MEQFMAAHFEIYLLQLSPCTSSLQGAGANVKHGTTEKTPKPFSVRYSHLGWYFVTPNGKTGATQGVAELPASVANRIWESIVLQLLWVRGSRLNPCRLWLMQRSHLSTR